MVHDEKSRNAWKLAVIEESVRGNDGLMRSASIRTKNGQTNRPITKLYLLEIGAKSNKKDRKATDHICRPQMNSTHLDQRELLRGKGDKKFRNGPKNFARGQEDVKLE